MKITKKSLLAAGFTDLGDGEYKKGDLEIYLNDKDSFRIKSDPDITSMEQLNGLHDILHMHKK